MKYRCESVVDVPRARFIELFDDPDNMLKWSPGLKSFEHLEGTPGQPGAKSRLVFTTGKREMEMIETIIVRNLPDEFSGTYDAKNVHNITINHFHEVDGKTHWQLETEFQIQGFLKLIALLMPGMFKKESMKHMNAFKAFAESQ
jgi:hypothetical protein